MATTLRSRTRRSQRHLNVAKPSGSLHPRVQKVGPEHFGVVAVDCAKDRSKWMLSDFYGRILVPPTVLEHNGHGFAAAIAQIRTAIQRNRLGDVIVAIERTGIYHLPIKRRIHIQQLRNEDRSSPDHQAIPLACRPRNQDRRHRPLRHPPRHHQRLRPHRGATRRDPWVASSAGTP